VFTTIGGCGADVGETKVVSVTVGPVWPLITGRMMAVGGSVAGKTPAVVAVAADVATGAVVGVFGAVAVRTAVGAAGAVVEVAPCAAAAARAGLELGQAPSVASTSP
jgi:hypothetical protein